MFRLLGRYLLTVLTLISKVPSKDGCSLFTRLSIVAIYGSNCAHFDRLYYLRHSIYLAITALMLLYFTLCFLLPIDHFFLVHRNIFDLTASQSQANSVANFHLTVLMILLATLSNHFYFNWYISSAIKVQVALICQTTKLVSLFLFKPEWYQKNHKKRAFN